MSEKIRPKSHSSFKEQGEAELPEVAVSGKPFEVDEETDIQVGNRTFAPAEAAKMRAENLLPNALGKPFEPNEAEVLLLRFEKAKAAHKANYAKTRNMDLEEPYLEARRALIAAGLMQEQ